jgi:pyruvate/2-oxoglutarate dehydrogenase complex dihydrolipoamide acyltransferase (E2) component
MQQQAIQNAQNFYGQSIGRIKSQVQNYRSQLEQYSQQVPQGDAQAQIQEMIDSYTELEGSIDQAAQDMDVEDQMNQAAQDTSQQIMQTAQGAAQQVQDTAGQAAGQAQQAAGQATDQVGQAAQQGQQAVGQAAQQGQQAVGGDGPEEPRATNAARRKAEQLGVDLSTVKGTGSGGLITINDVVGS